MPKVLERTLNVTGALKGRIPSSLSSWFQLLRWNKPSGRLILLIPAGWSLWLAPSSPPSALLVIQILVGGLVVSAAGCIANDLWDRRFDREVERTQGRPLARGRLTITTAVVTLLLLLLASLGVVLTLPETGRQLCLGLALLALPPILLYPSAKRWFPFPQAVLAFCWGFAVLIPWAASESSLALTPELAGCWLATVVWTFGFDTVYAMADRPDDRRLGLRSSALTLGASTGVVVMGCYAVAVLSLGAAALSAGLGWMFWVCWLLGGAGMLLEARQLRPDRQDPMSVYGRHFQHQVWLGALLLLGLVLGGQPL